MPYAKKYDRTEVLDVAVELFRRKGFEATSTSDLANELGINRKSMYAEFGSKQGLFEAALERYEAHHLTRVLSVLESGEAEVDDVKKAFYGYASAGEGRFRGLGCLMCNTAVERAALDPESGKYVANYIERFTVAFENALLNSQDQGSLAKTVDIKETAQFLTTCMIGISACIRAEAPQEQLWATYNVVANTLDRIKAGG